MKKTDAKRALVNMVDNLIFKAVKARQPGGKFKNRATKRMARILKIKFNQQMKWLLAEASKMDAFKSSPVKFITKKGAKEDAKKIANRLPLVEEMTEDIVAYSSASLNRGANDGIRKLNLGRVGISFDLDNPEAVDYLEALETLQLSNYKGSISRTTKEAIQKLLVDGARDGLSYSELAKQIMDQGESGVFSYARGELISVREIGFAYSKGERIVIDEYIEETDAEMEKNWLTAGDGNVRPEHLENERAGWIPIDEKFPGTDESEAPSEDFGCRCVTSYREV